MSILDNPRHERFAQALAAGKSADEAYQEAGYKPNRGNASTLKANQNVEARVAELQGETAEKVGITVESLTAMLLQDRSGARTEKQFAAAISAVEKLGKLHGLIVDRKEVRTGRLDELSDAEIAALIRAENPGLIAGVGAKANGSGKPH